MRVRSAFRSAADRFVDRAADDAGRRARRGSCGGVRGGLRDRTGVDRRPNAGSPRLEIVWEGGVDLDFDDLEDDGRLEQARFRGDVRVASDDFKLGSDALVVDFAKGATARPSNAFSRPVGPGWIGSAKSVRFRRASIDLALTRTDDGRTMPTAMVAEGAVEASDPGQTLWTESTAWFASARVRKTTPGAAAVGHRRRARRR